MIEIDRTVVDALRRGDERAYRVVVDSMLGPVHGFLSRLCGDSDTAADLAQETFIAVWRSIDSFRGRSSFRTWVFGIAYHQFLRYRDRRGVETTQLEDIEQQCSSGPQAIVEEAEAGSRVREAVDALPDLYREVVCLTHLEGLTYREAGEVLGISIGTVKSRMNAAFRMLRETLGGVVEDESTVREPEGIPGRRIRAL